MIAKAVIFDLDGTLLDTLADLTYAVNLVMDDYSLPHRTRDEVASFVGDGAAKLVERAFPAGTDAEVLQVATEKYKKLYLENMLRESAPFPKVTEMLCELKRRGLLCAVVSNKYYASTHKLCDRFFPMLDGCLGEMEERGIRRKPHPDMLIEMMRRLGVTADETIYVGDSEVDLELSRRAGVRCIALSWGMRTRDELIAAGAEIIADNADELMREIAKQNTSQTVD